MLSSLAAWWSCSSRMARSVSARLRSLMSLEIERMTLRSPSSRTVALISTGMVVPSRRTWVVSKKPEPCSRIDRERVGRVAANSGVSMSATDMPRSSSRV